MTRRWHFVRIFPLGPWRQFWAALLLYSVICSAGSTEIPRVALGSAPQETMLRPKLVMVMEEQAAGEAAASWGPQLALDQARSGRTVPLRVAGPPYRSDRAHWALTQLVHQSNETDWVIYYRLATLENVQAFARVADGPWLPLKGLHHQTKLFQGYHYPSFALSLPKGQVADVAIRVHTRAPIRMPILAVPGYHFYESQRSDLVIAGIVLAVPIVVLLYLVLLLPKTANVGTAWFIALIALESLGALWVSGHGHVLMPGIDRETWPVIGRLAYMAMIVVGWIHLRRFVGAASVPSWANFTGWAIVVLMAASVLLELTGWANTRNAFTYGVLVFPLLVVVMALRAWRNGVRYAGLYALAWSAFVISAVLSFLGLVGWAQVSAWQVYSVQSSVAAILFGLIAVGYVRDRDQAFAQTRKESDSLNAEKLRLQEALNARREFFATTNHDLRQPLQAMSIYLDLARKEAVAEVGSKRLQTYLDDASAAYANVSHFLDSLLDLARLEAHVIRPRPEALALDPLLQQIAREYRHQAARVGLELRLVSRDAYALVDRQLLARILRNLLGNAIRYTRTGGVLLAVRKRGSHWRLEVIDTGAGFTEAQQSKLYQAFSPGKPDGQPGRWVHPSGLGLGLYIVNQLAHAMGLALELKTRPGRGSRFSLLLPAIESEQVRALSGVLPDSHALQGLRIGILDDDPELIWALSRMVEASGASAVCAPSVAEMVAALKQGPPIQILLADYRLGHDSKLTASLPLIRAHCDCPVLVLTGDNDLDTMQDLAAHGVMDVLLKPVDAAILFQSLQRILERTLSA